MSGWDEKAILITMTRITNPLFRFLIKSITWSLGYMNNLVGNQKPYSVHYVGFDMIIENPFGVGTPSNEGKKPK